MLHEKLKVLDLKALNARKKPVAIIEMQKGNLKTIAQIAHMRVIIPFFAVIAIFGAIIPWYADNLQNKALKQAERGHYAESLHSARRAASLNPLSIDAKFVLAGAQQRLGREAEARETLLAATRMQPSNYLVWEQLATFEREKWNEPDKAREHFAVALSLNPHDAQLRNKAALEGQ